MPIISLYFVLIFKQIIHTNINIQDLADDGVKKVYYN